MSDNDTLFWRMLALFQSLPDLQPAQIVDWLAQECGETLTPARLATLTQPQLAASFPSATAGSAPIYASFTLPSERRSCWRRFAPRMA